MSALSTKDRTDLNEAYDTMARAYKNLGLCYESIADAQRGMDSPGATACFHTGFDPCPPSSHLKEVDDCMQEISELLTALTNAQATTRRLIDTELRLYQSAV